MRRLASLLSSITGAASLTNCSSRLAWSVRPVTCSRSCMLALRSASTCSPSASAAGPLSAAVPTTRPIASARNTAVSDTTWYRKLITLIAPQALEQLLQVKDQIVPPLRGEREIGLAHCRHRHSGRHRGDRGQDEQQHGRTGDALLVEPAHALGLDQ